MWSSDHFGWPITARPFGATGTRQFIEVAEVLSQMVRRACLFRPAEGKRASTGSTTITTTTTITSTTTTTNASLANRRVKSTEGEKDEVLKEPVAQTGASYSDLVSLISNSMEKFCKFN